MYSGIVATSTRSILAAVAIAGTLFAGSVAADDHKVIVAIPVTHTDSISASPPERSSCISALSMPPTWHAHVPTALAWSPPPTQGAVARRRSPTLFAPSICRCSRRSTSGRIRCGEALAHGIELPAELAAK